MTEMPYCIGKLDEDEYDALTKDIVDIALKIKEKEARVLIRILQLFLNGYWIEAH